MRKLACNYQGGGSSHNSQAVFSDYDKFEIFTRLALSFLLRLLKLGALFTVAQLTSIIGKLRKGRIKDNMTKN